MTKSFFSKTRYFIQGELKVETKQRDCPENNHSADIRAVTITFNKNLIMRSDKANHKCAKLQIDLGYRFIHLSVFSARYLSQQQFCIKTHTHNASFFYT